MSGGLIWDAKDHFWMDGPGREREAAATQFETFAYYTRFETAKQALAGNTVWMRNCSRMNDTSEISFGLSLLRRAWQTDEAQSLRRSINAVHSNVYDEMQARLTEMEENLLDGVYVTCVSQHSRLENNMGRLSMWRAYGANDGVAIVIKKETLLTWAFLPVYAVPVRYGSNALTGATLNSLEMLATDEDFIDETPREQFIDFLIAYLQLQVIQSKHESFYEEQEWRIAYIPSNYAFLNHVHPLAPKALMSREVILAGELQEIVELPVTPFLIPDPSQSSGLKKATLNDILDRIIIGPAVEADRKVQEFVALLDSLGIEDSCSKVIKSNVPLRV